MQLSTLAHIYIRKGGNGALGASAGRQSWPLRTSTLYTNTHTLHACMFSVLQCRWCSMLMYRQAAIVLQVHMPARPPARALRPPVRSKLAVVVRQGGQQDAAAVDGHVDTHQLCVAAVVVADLPWTGQDRTGEGMSASAMACRRCLPFTHWCWSIQRACAGTHARTSPHAYTLVRRARTHACARAHTDARAHAHRTAEVHTTQACIYIYKQCRQGAHVKCSTTCPHTWRVDAYLDKHIPRVHRIECHAARPGPASLLQ